MMFNGLTCLGHTRLWLSEISSGNQFLITWNGRILAAYDLSLESWCLRKNADVVDDMLILVKMVNCLRTTGMQIR
uniref:hypothetical protein n=1 Tax=Serratia proteamaculans TaxID=28151 RepID=UPI001F4C2BA6|nr:hypothetical protein [Serratia proteamaculans]